MSAECISEMMNMPRLKMFKYICVNITIVSMKFNYPTYFVKKVSLSK